MDENYIKIKPDEADRQAETTTERLSHEEVFGEIRKMIGKKSFSVGADTICSQTRCKARSLINC